MIPLSSLSMFTPKELGRLISGESSPDWSAEELLMYCEPAAGYSRNSKGFLMLIETLASLDTLERRAFLRFVTGCPTLPPGGLRNLSPKLKVTSVFLIFPIFCIGSSTLIHVYAKIVRGQSV